MKEALALYKQERESQDAQRVEAVLVGTRLGDPFAGRLCVSIHCGGCVLTFYLAMTETLQTFAPTDADWPALMRVHPILDWTYADIWEFLRCPDLGDGGVGWCDLYDYGWVAVIAPAVSIEAHAQCFIDTRHSARHSTRYQTRNCAMRRESPGGGRHGSWRMLQQRGLDGLQGPYRRQSAHL